jgi:hypothetical protein
VAICPSSTGFGTKVSSRDAPLPKQSRPLHFDQELGYRTR